MDRSEKYYRLFMLTNHSSSTLSLSLSWDLHATNFILFLYLSFFLSFVLTRNYESVFWCCWCCCFCCCSFALSPLFMFVHSHKQQQQEKKKKIMRMIYAHIHYLLFCLFEEKLFQIKITLCMLHRSFVCCVYINFDCRTHESKLI